jgi:hypothetical protein
MEGQQVHCKIWRHTIDYQSILLSPSSDLEYSQSSFPEARFKISMCLSSAALAVAVSFKLDSDNCMDGLDT